jgi:hypothetical protein
MQTMQDARPWHFIDDTAFEALITAQPVNAPIMAWLKANSEPRDLKPIPSWQSPDRVPLIDKHPYVLHSHPDLSEVLSDAAEELPSYFSQFLFGYKVLANPQGVIFAAVVSFDKLLFRLPERMRWSARWRGARRYAENADDWFVFDVWRTKKKRAGDPNLVRETPLGFEGSQLDIKRTMEQRKRIAFFRVWCKAAYEYADMLAK